MAARPLRSWRRTYHDLAKGSPVTSTRTQEALAELNAAAGGLRFELRTASSFGPSQPVATLTTGQPLSPEQTEALRFSPWTTGPGIRPAGWLNLLRDTAYKASQRGRPC